MSGRRKIMLAPATVGVAAVAVLVVLALPGLGFLARGLVAGVFLLAGIAKLRDRAPFSDVLAGFGVPGSVSPPVAVLLPLAEVAAAVALLVPATSSAGAVGALVLLVLFSLVVAVALFRGRTAGCGCFGKDRSAAMSQATLLRNGILIGLAGGLALTPAGSAAAFGRTSSLASIAAIGVAALVVIGLFASRRGGGELTDEPSVSVAVVPAGEATESVLTRRKWMRVAGGVGLVGALGSWFGWLGVPLAQACPKLAYFDTCGSCTCAGANFPPLCCQNWVCGDSCFGFAGGGVVRTPSGTAQASFFGNHSHPPAGYAHAFSGALVWSDATWHGTGLLLHSTQIKKYRKVPGTNIRELTGLASANGHGMHPFVLRVIDAGQPGSGADTVSLTVSGIAGSGAGGTGSNYAANGHLAQGDLTVKLSAHVTR